MRVCFVSPAAFTEPAVRAARCSKLSPIASDRPPLGILSLAAVLERRGIEQEFLNLNRFIGDSKRPEAPATDPGLFAAIVDDLARRKAHVFAFGTLAGSYPLTLRLARETRRLHPGAVVLFGGPQATAVDAPTLREFPFVDMIVRGEAEETLPAVLEALHDPARLECVPGIAFRRNGSIVCTPDPARLPVLDEIPDPAYHLWPGMDGLDSLPMEIGRGCPFACKFCSTSRFFRRRFRLRSPRRILESMRRLRQRYGVSSFTLIHDAFTVDRRKVLEFCQALEDSGESFSWSCSARTDCVDEALLDRMASVGCRGIFFGIETASKTVQQAIGKCLDLDEARGVIRCACAAGMRTAVSVIAGFPDETHEDLRMTVDFLADSLTLDRSAPQFHLLAPLAGTELQQRFQGRLEWDGISSDIASIGVPQEPEDLRLIVAHPGIFPDFYAIPTPHLDRRFLQELRRFIRGAEQRFRWLIVALHQYRGSILDVFESWQDWRKRAHSDIRDDEDYYASVAFRRDFIEFVAAAFPDADADPEALAVAALVEFERRLSQAAEPAACDTEALPEPSPGAAVDIMDAIPLRAPGVTLLELSFDYQAVIDCLRCRRSPRDVPRRQAFVADRDAAGQGAEVVQLSRLAALLLQLCDGRRTAREIARLFTRLDPDLAALPAEPACLFALNELASQRLLAFRPLPESVSSR